MLRFGFRGLLAFVSNRIGDSAGEALTLLERGRGSIMGLLINDRSDTACLKASYHEMGDTYERLRTEVKTVTPQIVQPFDVAQPRTTDRVALVREMDACIARIRQLPGYERFLMGPTSDELKSYCLTGSYRRCKCHRHQSRCHRHLGTGIASSFPFHVAGDYSKGLLENTLSQTIPSYTPTIKALAYSRSRSLKRARTDSKKASVLVVTMPTTPGQRPLLGVDREGHAIQESCASAYSSEILQCPTAKQVLEKITGSDIIHFACHGSSDPTNPSDTHFLLQQSDVSGPVVDRLTASDISNVDTLGQAWIAYLSACSTAEFKARSSRMKAST